MRRGENALAPLHQAGIPCDPEHPRFHALRFAKLVEAFEDLHQSLLRNLFSVLPLAAHQEAVLKNLVPEDLYKPVKCPWIPRKEVTGKLDFVVFCHRSPVYRPAGLEHRV